ncbi:choline/ethanolamine kinase family protein [Corallincola platygyrae]|uniref:Choline/ethanolamine kinase family protein n=1 Tax=Corallincola platygyrae TaxID=1193278 RepID=A0ABW4XJB2_9GAMM
MQPLTEVQKLLKNLPGRLLPVTPEACDLTPLSGGFNNLVWRFTANDGAGYVIKLFNNDNVIPSGRSNERKLTQQASDIGITPRLVYWDDNNTFAVTEYQAADGSRLSKDMALRTLIKLHGLHTQSSQTVDYLEDFSVNEQLKAFSFKRVYDWQNRMLSSALARCVCHHDLCPDNLVIAKDQLWVIDFEYSGWGHPLFDLASLSESFSDPETKLQLWQTYLSTSGLPCSKQEREAWQAAQALYTFLCANWFYRQLSSQKTNQRLAGKAEYYHSQLIELISRSN